MDPNSWLCVVAVSASVTASSALVIIIVNRALMGAWFPTSDPVRRSGGGDGGNGVRSFRSVVVVVVVAVLLGRLVEAAAMGTRVASDKEVGGMCAGGSNVDAYVAELGGDSCGPLWEQAGRRTGGCWLPFGGGEGEAAAPCTRGRRGQQATRSTSCCLY